MRYQAALLASHGYPALALGYFALPGLPAILENIPIEYFATAARTLPGPVRVLGNSRGTEAALLVSALYPDLVHGTVLYAPADHVGPAFPSLRNAWTVGGKPQTAIPFRQIVGPVLAFAGTDDRIWGSATAAGTIQQATGGQSVLYPDAGHNVGSPPYLASGTTFRHPVTGETLHFGGIRSANQAAQRKSWSTMLDLLNRA
jgi:pimeloyl-ACP methyl ester carboxylesterase